MAILKLSQEELNTLKQDEADFIMDKYNKDSTVQRLRPSFQQRVIRNDESTFNYIKDTLDIVIPLANKNGTPLTLNLIAAALGYNKNTLSHYCTGQKTASINAAEEEWFKKITGLIQETLAIARTDVEMMQLQRRIDSKGAAEAIHDIDVILDEVKTQQKPTLIKVVDDYE